MAYGVNKPFGLMPVDNGQHITQRTRKYKIYASSDGLTTYSTPLYMNDPVQFGTSVAATPATNGLIGTIARWAPAFAAGPPGTFSGVPIIGTFQGCDYYSLINGTIQFQQGAIWPGAAQVVPGSEIVAYITDDPEMIYEVQVSTHINAANNGFVADPIFPNLNPTGGAPFIFSGSFGSNFGLNIGGGTNFTSITTDNTPGGPNAGYANNPTTGNNITKLSGFYLDVNTSTVVAPYNNADYSKIVTTLPVKAISYSNDSRNIPAPGLTMQSTPFLNVFVKLNNPTQGNNTATPVFVA